MIVAWFRFAGGERNRYMGLFTGEGWGLFFLSFLVLLGDLLGQFIADESMLGPGRLVEGERHAGVVEGLAD